MSVSVPTPIRLGVMGCASIAHRLVIPAIRALPEHFHLVAIASRTADKADRFSQEFDCEGVVGYDTLLDRPDIEAIYMPLPTGLHKEWIMKALAAGKAVYAEKSIAMNAADAAAMVALAREKNVALMEGYMFQYHAQQQIVKRLIREDIIGEIRRMDACFGFPPLAIGNFRYDSQIGGGALMDAAGYVVRAAQFLLPDVHWTVTGASVHYNETGTSLWGSAYMQGDNGLGASLGFGFDNYYQCNYTLWGSKGKLTAHRAYTPKPHEKPQITIETAEGTQTLEAPADNHFVRAMEVFHRLIVSKNPTERETHYSDILSQSQALDKIAACSLLHANNH